MKTRTKTLRKGALLAGIAVTSTGEVLDGGENWTLTRTLRDSLGTSVMRDITYYDGLGYPTQAIQADASPAGGSIVTPIYYDNVRRDDARTYLPFVSATGMGKVASPFTAQQSWYTRGTSYGVSYDKNSEQPFPGHSWMRKTWDYLWRPSFQRNPGVGLPPK